MKFEPARSGGRKRVVISLALSCFLPAIAYSQTTGWNQTAGGTYDYNATGNWVDGVINGIWDPSLTLAGGQTITFGADTGLGTGLDFSYAGGQNVTLQGTGGSRILTLGGDVLVNTASGNRTITIGNTNTSLGLSIDLDGGSRVFTVGGSAGSNNIRSLTLVNNVTNGSLVLNGGGFVNLNGTVNNVASIRLQNTNLKLNGVSATNSLTTLSGALQIDGSPTHGGISLISITPNASRNTTLAASSLVRENHGVAFFRGTNLGGTLNANGGANITFTTAPTAQLVGGGLTAGTKNISILPWAVGSISASGAADSFVTYDSTNGIRPLDLTTEFETYNNGHIGAVTSAGLNSRIASGATVEFTGDNTVNSLFVGDSNTSSTTTLAGSGVLTVTSGAVFFQQGNVSQNLDFGSREGVVGYTQGKGSTLSGGIAGSGGATFYQSVTNAAYFSAGTGLTLSGASTYTGDTTVLGRLTVTHADALPSGDRTGNLTVNGILDINTSVTINGLSGTGNVSRGVSGTGTVTLGDNDADGDFSGAISNNGALTINKIGSGTQIFSGDNTYTGDTNVNEGTLVVNGSLANTTTTIASSGTLKGTGTIGGATTVNGTFGPGNSIGTMNFLQSLSLNGISNFEIDPTLGLGLNSDLANVSGAITYGGDLNVLYGGSNTNFASGMVFNLFDAASFSGEFESIHLPDLGGTGLSWQNDLATNGTITVVPEPAAALLGGVGMILLLRRRRA
jgi:fibronectin-binding autotransporter adhesin